MEKLRRTPKTFTLVGIGTFPYENRFVRSLIDSCAFHIYGHWVKRGEEQNRAALFENQPKRRSHLTDSMKKKFHLQDIPAHKRKQMGSWHH